MNAKLFAIGISLSILSNVNLAATHANLSIEPSKQQNIVKKINLNSASLDELTNSFKGIGAKRAENIIKFRTETGKLTSIADLGKVKGIGNAFVEKYKQELENIFSVS